MKNSRRTLIMAAVIVAIGAAAFLTVQLFFSRVNLRLEITGSPWMNVAGTCTADGHTLSFGPHEGPNTVKADGRSFSYSIENSGDGPMTVEVFVDDESHGSVTADGEYTLVRGTYGNGDLSQSVEQVAEN